MRKIKQTKKRATNTAKTIKKLKVAGAALAAKKKTVSLADQCPHCASTDVKVLIRGESMTCGGCGITYSVTTGRVLKSQQKHGILEPKPERYVRGLGFTTHGNRTIDIDDDVARMLRGTDSKEMYDVAANMLNESPKSLQSQYGHLNVGMQRMNLGNRMRKALRSKNA